MTHWWQTGVIYQIYPRSFQDADGDGVGDLKGIAARLDYLKDLGVDAVWISPIFVSPMADFGYDVANYTAIDPLFGTLEDFDALVAKARTLGLKIILDLVPNHTSECHKWFRESRAARSSPKRDWYIWRDGRGGGPPNNWISNFGGSAWEFDSATGQYYYHAFLKEQPDLNWRNPEVRAAMHDVLRFWMDRGADGFRVDVIWHLIKDDKFRDNPPNPDWHPDRPEIESLLETYSANRPEVHEVIAELRRVADEYPERLLIGEIYLPVEKLVTYYGPQLNEVQLPFNFQLLHTQWLAEDIARVIERYEALLPSGAWPNWVLGNHDRQRIAKRLGQEQARVAAMLLLTLRGTPTLYYGDEIGIANVDIPPERVQDPWEKNEQGIGVGRDPVRTPMQWDATKNAGFSAAEPWLPLSADWSVRNVAVLDKQPGSILAFYRLLLEVRRSSPALQAGAYRQIFCTDGVLVFERVLDGERVAVVLNLTPEERAPDLPEDIRSGQVLAATGGTSEVPQRLAADQGLVIALRQR